MSNSIIIKNGTIIDGTGRTKAYKGDIKITGEKISAIGTLLKTSNEDQIIDASGLFVVPGFIDLTTHSDNHWTLFSHPHQESFIRQGVTTIIGGHGGASLAPVIKKEAVESLEKWMDTSRININWQTLKEFFEELENHHLSINFGTLAGYDTLKQNIVGSDLRPLTKTEKEELKLLIKETLKEGAFGISTNLSTPLSKNSTDEEIIEALKAAADYKLITMHHLENEGKNILPALSRLVMFLRNSKAKGHISHFKVLGKAAWENFENALKMIELAQKDGIFLSCDFFPYVKTGSSLDTILPNWFKKEGKKKMLKLLKDEPVRQNLIEYIKSLTLHYDKIIIASTRTPSLSTGKTIEQFSKESGLSAEEAILDILKINEFQVSIFNEVISEEHLKILAQKKYSAIASDGIGYDIEKIKNKKDLPHPRSFGSFPKALNDFIKKEKLLSWENLIGKMTSLPAYILGIKKRGILKVNYYADIVIFDPETIKDKADYENPFQYAEGIEYVIINGAIVLSKGTLKETKAGKILKSPIS